MYADLAPEALRVRSAACFLLGVSMFMCGSLEGFMGIIAACTILCCAAPGSLGTAYAARCARVAALLAAGFGAVHLVALSLFSVAVLPEGKRDDRTLRHPLPRTSVAPHATGAA